MPAAASVPGTLGFILGSMHLGIGTVTDDAALYADNPRYLYGPIILVPADAAGGLTVHSSSGVALLRISADGNIRMAGQVTVNAVKPYDPPDVGVTYDAGVLFKNAAGDIVCYFDQSGNLVTPAAIAEEEESIEIEVVLEDLDVPDVIRYGVESIGVNPTIQLIISNPETTLPLLQVATLDALGEFVGCFSMAQDGTIRITGTVAEQVGVSDTDVYWSF